MTYPASQFSLGSTGDDDSMESLAEWRHDDNDEARRRIRTALRSGTLSGAPLSEATTGCLLNLLDRLGWTPDYEALARAMPHLPDELTIDDVREICARLGFPSETMCLRSSEIEPGRLPALVLDREPLIATAAEGGKVKFEESVTLRRRRPPFWGRRNFALFGTVSKPTAHGGDSWMRALFRRQRGTITQLFVLTFLINTLTLGLSLTIMAIYDLVLPAMAYDTLVAIAAGALLALAVELSLRRIRARLLGFISGRVEFTLGSALFSKILALPLERTSTVTVSSQAARLKQFETVRELSTGSLGVVLLELPFALAFTGVLFLIAGPVGFVPLALVIVSVFLAGSLAPATRRSSSEAQAARAAHYELFLDSLANLRAVRTLGCEELWVSRLDDAALNAVRCRRRAGECKRLLAAFSSTAPPLAGGATVVLGALMVMEGALSTGALIACMLVVWRIVAPIQQALLLLPRLTDMGQLIAQIDTLMKMPSDSDHVGLHRPTGRRRGQVTLVRASFRYAGANEPAVAGVDLDIAAGEFVAISGPSGAGKSTLLHLVHGLVMPQAGVVALDGQNIRQLSIADIRSATGFVAHKPVFFHGTIAQNMRLAAPAASDFEIEAVADELGILDHIRALPEGFETRLTEERQEHVPRGVKQALALARTLLRDPPVLLLDEPAQSLDPALERSFLDAVNSRRSRSTIVMVSHRPSHVRQADRSVILDRGRIVSQAAPDPHAMGSQQ